MELEIRLADIQTSKTLHNNTSNNIEFLRNQLQQCLSNNRIGEAMNQCNEIIKIAQNFGLKEIREEHEQLLKYLKNQNIKNEINEQQVREQQIREQQAREQQLREQQIREQQAREKQIREQQTREQQLREQQIREQQAREQQIKKLNELKDKVLILNKEGLESIGNKDISKALEKYKIIKTLITSYIKK